MVVAEKAFGVVAFVVDLPPIPFHYLVMQPHLVDPCVIDELVQHPLLVHYCKQQNCYALKVEGFGILAERVSDVALDGDDDLFYGGGGDLLRMMEFGLKL